MLDTNIYSIVIWIIAILIASLDLVILIGSKNLSSRVFAFLTFTTAIWVASQGFLISTTSIELSSLYIRLQYILGLIISIGFYYFSIIYPYDNKPSTVTFYISGSVVLIFSYLCLFTNTIISGVSLIGGVGMWAWSFGLLNFIFDITFCGLWLMALKNIYHAYRVSEGGLQHNLGNMFWTLLFGIIPPTIFNIILPAIGDYGLNWIGPISSALWIFMIAYSIIKYRQMDVKTVITEILAIAVAVVFFINIFVPIPFGIFADISAFIISLILSVYLIRGVLREASQREKLKELNDSLEKKVSEQTLEIRNALEAEKKARQELEKLNDAKDQFIMITQHHLRTPVTSILWGLESTLKGEYGKLSNELRTMLTDMNASSKRLMKIVDDFLNITAIKIGTNILNLSLRSLKRAVEDIILELKPEIQDKNISVNFTTDDAAWPQLRIDHDKMRESLFIILENAVRYNHAGGSVDILPSVDGDTFELTVKNTGIGITHEEASKIGSSLFYRSEAALQNHPIGMGIGLSVVKAIIKAHKGTFSIESNGKNEGAKVTVRLPLK